MFVKPLPDHVCNRLKLSYFFLWPPITGYVLGVDISFEQFNQREIFLP